jgi:hypothetical protein
MKQIQIQMQQRVRAEAHRTTFIVAQAYEFKNDNYDRKMPCEAIGSGSGE